MNAILAEQPDTIADGGVRNPAPPQQLAAAAAGGVRPPCPMTGAPCAEQPACVFAEPLVRVGTLSCVAALGKTSCARWVEAVRREGREALEPQVEPAAADALPEDR